MLFMVDSTDYSRKGTPCSASGVLIGEIVIDDDVVSGRTLYALGDGVEATAETSC